MVANASEFDGDGIFAAVSVLSNNAGVAEDRCYEALKVVICEHAQLNIQFNDKLEILTQAILHAQELIKGGFF